MQMLLLLRMQIMRVLLLPLQMLCMQMLYVLLLLQLVLVPVFVDAVCCMLLLYCALASRDVAAKNVAAIGAMGPI